MAALSGIQSTSPSAPYRETAPLTRSRAEAANVGGLINERSVTQEPPTLVKRTTYITSKGGTDINSRFIKTSSKIKALDHLTESPKKTCIQEPAPLETRKGYVTSRLSDNISCNYTTMRSKSAPTENSQIFTQDKNTPSVSPSTDQPALLTPPQAPTFYEDNQIFELLGCDDIFCIEERTHDGRFLYSDREILYMSLAKRILTDFALQKIAIKNGRERLLNLLEKNREMIDRLETSRKQNNNISK